MLWWFAIAVAGAAICVIGGFFLAAWRADRRDQRRSRIGILTEQRHQLARLARAHGAAQSTIRAIVDPHATAAKRCLPAGPAPGEPVTRMVADRLQRWRAEPAPGRWVCGELDASMPDGQCGVHVADDRPCRLRHEPLQVPA
jgi:hypothetical protein